MSLLRQIISSVEEVELEQLKTRIPILRSDLHLLKSNVLKSLDEIYLQYLLKPQINLTDSNVLLKLHEELEHLKQLLAQAMKKEKCTEYNFKSLFEYIQESSDIFTEVKFLCQVHESIVSMKFQYNRGNYSDSLQKLKEVKDIIRHVNSKDMLKYFLKTVALFESSIFHEFDLLVKKKYVISSLKGVHSITVEQDEIIDRLIVSLYDYNKYIEQLDSLVNFLWKYILIPVIKGGAKIILNDNELKVINIKAHSNQDVTDVCRKLYKVNSYFQNQLQLCLDKTNSFSLLYYIGNQWKDRLSLLFINDCLQNIDTYNENFNYENIIEDVKQLQIEWNMMKFVINESILEYTLNLNKIYMNKKSTTFVKHVKDLVHTNKEIIFMSSLPILLNIQEMVDLIDQVLIKMKNSPEPTDFVLFMSILDSLAYYRQYIRKEHNYMIYKEIALIYNNCKYLAQEITKWNFLYCGIINKKIPFQDEASTFQSIGEEVLERFLDKQKRKIHVWLEEGYSCSASELQEFPEPSYKYIENCLKLLEHLKEAWYNILLQETYNKAITILCNIIYEFFIKFLLKYEKIHMCARENLSNLFEMLINYIKSHFAELIKAENFVTSWEKFNAISFVLNSNLGKIESQWCSKNNFLKTNLQANEMRILIKALFENAEDQHFYTNFLID